MRHIKALTIGHVSPFETVQYYFNIIYTMNVDKEIFQDAITPFQNGVELIKDSVNKKSIHTN